MPILRAHFGYPLWGSILEPRFRDLFWEPIMDEPFWRLVLGPFLGTSFGDPFGSQLKRSIVGVIYGVFHRGPF